MHPNTIQIHMELYLLLILITNKLMKMAFCIEFVDEKTIHKKERRHEIEK